MLQLSSFTSGIELLTIVLEKKENGSLVPADCWRVISDKCSDASTQKL
jgi:hypothetical protein